ncbi:MAG: tetratricopeptide repeat protein [Alphaproteobacteria bacterium]|jgi:protein O-GlcNAc transferase|nr:tetratricopeptide repeat protein [Alphaproteobacteria bacterium]
MSWQERPRQQKKAGKPADDQPSLEIQKTLYLGVQHQNAGDLAKAEHLYRQVLETTPDEPTALHLLGVLAFQTGRGEKATQLFTRAIAVQPDNAETHSNLGVALQRMGKLEDAVASFRTATTLQPEYVEAHSNLSAALQDLGKMEDAAISARTALTLAPDHADAHNNLGLALQDLGLLDDAAASYRRAIATLPGYADAGRNLLYVLLNIPGLSCEDLFAEHLRFADNHVPAIAQSLEKFSNTPDTGRRLRVGYLSSDFRNHPVGGNVLPLLSCHDKTEVEVFCYANLARSDSMTERFKSCTEHWRPVAGKSDANIANIIRADEIDILVTLAGRFDGNRPLVAAHRTAPVQVSFHDGATSGLSEMDYWLSDDFLHPPGTAEKFTEDLYRLPVFYQYLPMDSAPPVAPLSFEEAGYITFGSFNNPAKINDVVIDLWSRVLKAVDGSRLLLKFKNLYDQPSLQTRLLERFAACGISQDRIAFETLPDTFTEHLARYGDVDIALDPFPFNGATTTFQALWMGVPVVSLKGETFIQRAAGSMLHHVGLSELAVDTPDAYVACAKELADNPDRLKTLRADLRQRVAASPLCNAPAYARNVEAAYREMWRKWCGGAK